MEGNKDWRVGKVYIHPNIRGKFNIIEHQGMRGGYDASIGGDFETYEEALHYMKDLKKQMGYKLLSVKEIDGVKYYHYLYQITGEK